MVRLIVADENLMLNLELDLSTIAIFFLFSE